MDIGLGGIALSPPDDAPELIVGKIYDKCLVNLHEAGSLEVSIRVRRASPFRRDGKTSIRRYGCEFVGLRNPQATVMQRFVLQLERDRRASAAST